eukprot:TRINITY_DN11272_c0_g1_i1.p1 TRINITY_DN11272_c0_g1~~TRINITY_DN11272_c0_g1_i1.p1  ORF type:complete len:230 (+),score=23.06 TRINITY_DN11272_c0_g1_i1:48-692(+)
MSLPGATPPAPVQDNNARLRRVACGLVVVFSIASFFPGDLSVLFFYHPSTMIAGYLGLMVEGIALGRAIQKSKNIEDRLTKINAHMLTLAISVTLITIGFGVMYSVKNSKGKPHYTSWHGFIGCISVAAALIQSLLGFAMFFKVQNTLNLGIAARAALRKSHVILAIITTVGGIASIILGLVSNYAVSSLSVFTRLIIGGSSVSLFAASYLMSG